jgi:hypothetical protein
MKKTLTTNPFKLLTPFFHLVILLAAFVHFVVLYQFSAREVSSYAADLYANSLTHKDGLHGKALRCAIESYQGFNQTYGERHPAKYDIDVLIVSEERRIKERDKPGTILFALFGVESVRPAVAPRPELRLSSLNSLEYNTQALLQRGIMHALFFFLGLALLFPLWLLSGPRGKGLISERWYRAISWVTFAFLLLTIPMLTDSLAGLPLCVLGINPIWPPLLSFLQGIVAGMWLISCLVDLFEYEELSCLGALKALFGDKDVCMEATEILDTDSLNKLAQNVRFVACWVLADKAAIERNLDLGKRVVVLEANQGGTKLVLLEGRRA